MLKYLGFNEVYNYSFVSAKDLENFNLDKKDCLKIINSLSNDWEYMHPSLIPSILRTITDNTANFLKIKIFELSNIYIKKEDNKLPYEFLMFTGALSDKNNKNLFFEIKGVLKSLFKEIGVFDNIKFKIGDILNFQKGKTANIILGKENIGTLGVLDKKVAGLDSESVIFNLNFIKLIKRATSKKNYSPISKYPSVKMDLAFVVDEGVLYEDVLKEIKNAGGALVKDIQLFDIYRGEQIGSGKKSLAFAIKYGKNDRTLSSKEAKKIKIKLYGQLKKGLEQKLEQVIEQTINKQINK